MKLPIFESLHQTHVLLEVCKGVLTGSNDFKWSRHILGSNGQSASTTTSKHLKKTPSEDHVEKMTSSTKRSRTLSIPKTAIKPKCKGPVAKKARHNKSTSTQVSEKIPDVMAIDSINSDFEKVTDERQSAAEHIPDLVEVVEAATIASAQGTIRLRAKRGDDDVEVQ